MYMYFVQCTGELLLPVNSQARCLLLPGEGCIDCMPAAAVPLKPPCSWLVLYGGMFRMHHGTAPLD